MKKTIFVIDTDSYAGNFERDMCAYITGCIGECEVGEEFAQLYLQETGEKYSQFDVLLEHRPDDEGCCRPTYMYHTKGWLYDGETGAVPEAEFDQQKANEKYRLYTAIYRQNSLDRTEKIDVNNKNSGWDEKTKSKEIDRLKKEIEQCLSEKTVCPRINPYNSVAIFFKDTPSESQIAIMKERAGKFAEAKRMLAEKENWSWCKNYKLTIYGFRLVTETTIAEEVSI